MSRWLSRSEVCADSNDARVRVSCWRALVLAIAPDRGQSGRQVAALQRDVGFLLEDAMSQPASQMTIEALRSVPLFSSLDDEAATDLRNLLSDRVVPGNTRLFRQCDKGDAMY